MIYREKTKAVRAHLTKVHDEIHPEGSIYEVGLLEIGGAKWEVLILQTGATNVYAAREVERALSYFKPRLSFFVGVAGGLKDVKIGDVVAATKVYGFESAKADTTLLPRFNFGEANYHLAQIANSLARQQDRENWTQLIKYISNALPDVYVAPIASGERVVGSIKSDVYAFLKQNCGDALAVEMEGHGFLASVHMNSSVAALVVRGISDLVKGKAAADASGLQLMAASHAAAFTIAIIDKYSRLHIQMQQVEGITNSTPSTQVDLSQLSKLMAQLYPSGPKDRQVWERAGGDVSQLDTSQNGHSQWFSALKLISLGGGGNISSHSLLTIAKEDFPQNVEVILFSQQN